MRAAKKDILLLVDGNALVHRGFHAIPHLSTKKGEPTNGIYGFTLLFLRAIKELAPRYAAVAFDLPGGTFRDKIYGEYKAGRAKAPDELYAQIPRVMDLVKNMNVPMFTLPGYEADDVIGTLSHQAMKKGLETVILTGDMDALQLVDGQIKVFAPKQGLSDPKIYGSKEVFERYALKPTQLIDYKALRGDPSDNIPGVPGVGEKTAVELLTRFDTLEKIYKAVEKGETDGLKPRTVKLLEDGHDMAFMSKQLAAIVTDLPISLDLRRAELSDYDTEKVVRMFQELEFKSLIDKLPQSHNPKPQIAKTEPATGIKYQLVDSEEKYKNFINELKTQKEICIDTETTSLHPVEAKLLGIGVGWEENRAFYVLKEFLGPELKQILEDGQIAKIGHNIKYDYLVLKQAGIHLRGLSFDTMIAAYLLNPGARVFDLDSLAFNEFGIRKIPITDLIGPSRLVKGAGGKKQINMSEVEPARVAEYCAEDVVCTWRLKQKLTPELASKKLEKIFYEIDMPLIAVLAEMENSGIRVDIALLKRLSREAETVVEAIQAKIHRLAGEEFNIGSPIQLKKILFEKLGIPSDELKKGKTGLSTAATELEKLRGLHPIVDLIFEWRELTKLKNTYLDALPELVSKKTARLHTSFNQTIAATGRLSSSDPNLQNIPIRAEFGRKIRAAFAADKGFKLVAVDYSQIELRLAAHLSGDPKMIKVFQEGGDIHEATAREIFGTSDVTADMRRSAKTINFGVLYGLSAYGLTSRIPGVSQGSAKDFIEKYFETYSRLKEYLDEVIAETKRTGFVRNEIGRLRFLPEISSSQFQVRSAAERAAINMPFQSMNADIIKMAMNKLATEDLIARPDCRLLLQVHDELVFEIKENAVEKYVPQITKIMQGIYKLKVPLVVEAKVGDNWEEMERI